MLREEAIGAGASYLLSIDLRAFVAACASRSMHGRFHSRSVGIVRNLDIKTQWRVISGADAGHKPEARLELNRAMNLFIGCRAVRVTRI
jgi:hypothetical protein